MPTSTTYSIPQVGKKKTINTLLGGERTLKKGAAVQMFLFNSCTIVHKRAHPGHADLSH